MTSENHLDYATWLYNAELMYCRRHLLTGDELDVGKALNGFTYSSKSTQATPLTRIKAARAAISLLIHKEDWEQATSISTEALDCFPSCVVATAASKISSMLAYKRWV